MLQSLELDYIDLTDLIPIHVGDFGAVAQALAGQYGEDLITEVHCGGTTTVFRCANLRRVCCVLQSARRRAIIHRSLLWSSRSCRGADDIVGQLTSLEGRGAKRN